MVLQLNYQSKGTIAWEMHQCYQKVPSNPNSEMRLDVYVQMLDIRCLTKHILENYRDQIWFLIEALMIQVRTIGEHMKMTNQEMDMATCLKIL